MNVLLSKSKLAIIILIIIVFASTVLSTALSAGAVVISVQKSNFSSYLSTEVQIPFKVVTGGAIDKLTLEASSSLPNVVPNDTEHLYISTTGEAIKANPAILTNANGTITGTIFVKPSESLTSPSKNSITLSAKTSDDQVAKLHLNVYFARKSMTSGDNTPGGNTPGGNIEVTPTPGDDVQISFLGFVCSTDGFQQGLTPSDFDGTNSPTPIASDAPTATPTVTPTDMPTDAPTVTPSDDPITRERGSSSDSSTSGASSDTSSSGSYSDSSPAPTPSDATNPGSSSETGENPLTPPEINVLLSLLLVAVLLSIAYIATNFLPLLKVDNNNLK